MKRTYIITFLTCICVFAFSMLWTFVFKRDDDAVIKVGFMYVGDASTGYTNNFIDAQNELEKLYPDRVEVIAMYNVAEGTEENYLQQLVDAGCSIIFSTSYNYGVTTKEFAGRYPDIEFCMATCDNANEEPYLKNYHTFMGAIYEGRYASGVAAGMKLKELIETGRITVDDAKIGYVAAYPYAEVISGYTAFLLGVRSVVPDAVMTVKYTYKWNDYLLEKKYAAELINEGCVIISQHSDTAGPAIACEETDAGTPVYLISYNQSMADIAPTTYITGCKINWKPYVTGAVGAVLEGRNIEKTVRGKVNGNDIGAGFDEDWVEMLKLNEVIAADGTKEKLDEVIEKLKRGELYVFKGDYLGVNVDDPEDIYDLSQGYEENRDRSAPSFNYILKDVITIEE